jgi:hypothetical protein
MNSALGSARIEPRAIPRCWSSVTGVYRTRSAGISPVGSRFMKSASSSSRRAQAQSKLNSNAPFSQVTPVRAAWDQLVQGKHRPLRAQLRVQLRKLTANTTSASSS